MNSLQALTSLDGRYQKATQELRDIFSEYGLIKKRVYVEMQWFKFLTCELKLFALTKGQISDIDQISEKFTLEDAAEIKEIEKTTNHDVKAVEYYIKQYFETLNLSQFKEFVHFGLTSQDINNTAIPLAVRDGHQLVLFPALQELVEALIEKAMLWKDIPMLARTHGQFRFRLAYAIMW